MKTKIEITVEQGGDKQRETNIAISGSVGDIFHGLALAVIDVCNGNSLPVTAFLAALAKAEIQDADSKNTHREEDTP